MAVLTYYLTNGVDANGWQALSESTQAAVNTAAGWVVGTGATNHSELFADTERAANTFTGTTVPDGTLDLTNKDAFRSPTLLSGSFPSANWTFQFAMRSTVQAGAADGRIRFRILKADADGSNATEITAGQQQASIATNVGSAADVLSSLTVNPGAFVIADQYLFIQIAWERTGAGGMSTTNMRFRTGSASTPTGTVITTANFLEDTVGTLTKTLGALLLASVATVSVAGAATPTLGACTSVSAGTVAWRFDDIRQNIIDGFDSAQAEAAGWDARRSTIPVTAVVRTSDTVVTITLPADSGYAISAQETITGTIPAVALVGGAPVLATPTITIEPDSGGDISGSLSKTLSALTNASTGTVEVRGSSARTLGSLTAASTSTVDVAGTSATIFEPLTSTSTAGVVVAATLTRTLAPLTASSTGTAPIVATLTRTLAPLTVEADGVIGNPPVTATLNKTLGLLSQVSTGQVVVAGSTTRTLGLCAASSTGTVDVNGNTTRTLASVTSSGQGAVLATAALSRTLDTLTSISSVGVEIRGQLVQTLGPVSVFTGPGYDPVARPGQAYRAVIGATITGSELLPSSITSTVIREVL